MTGGGPGLGVLFAAIFLCASATWAEPPPDAHRELLDRLRNGLYDGVFAEPVRLENGVYEGEPFLRGGSTRPVLALVDRGVAYGDLNADGREDAVAFLLGNFGGEGAETWLAALVQEPLDPGPGEPNPDEAPYVAVPLGERVQVRDFAIDAGRIVVDLVAPGPGEPLCCPSRKVRKTFRLQKGALAELVSEELGRLSLEDLEGSSWILEELPRGERVPDGVRTTAEFRDGRIAGSAGCNRYFARVAGSGPGAIAIARSGATRKMCSGPIMEREAGFLAALERTTGFGFFMGRLVLSYDDGGTARSMLFSNAD